MSFPMYPEYKHTEIEWLPRLPTHWTLSKFARHFAIRMGETIPEGELSEDGWLPVFSATEKDKYYGFVSNRVPLARAGDLVIPARGNSIGHVKLVREMASATQTTIVANNIDPGAVCGKYAYYWSIGLREILFHFDRTAIPQITTEYVSRNKFAFPGLLEQTQIARFLDHETAKIDTLIHGQKRLIELLKEKRQAVISHAVTKGLDPDVPMKDSGVEWLGEVPAHWVIVPFNYAIAYQEGPGIMGADFHEEGVPLLRVSGVKHRWASLRGCNYLDPSKVRTKWSHFQLKEGDLLISASASMGTVCEVGPSVEGAIPYTGLIRLNPRNKLTCKDFVRAVVGSSQFSTQIDLFKAGSTIQHFGPTHLAQMKIVLPPIEEQSEIALHVDAMVASFESLLAEAHQTNDLLQERRSALISAAVTGKIDVRNWQPPADESAFD
ncbi:restriction endonuclease subunit S [Marinobacter gelidimuriae]|uniref:restriction endonuclease subunit S n=1 Tax=Marinobacter gelidimuriae TaxID=2739064 RepID=UPI00036738BA|nr:restriction endonuclease subunit S [Marinobacter gelidimuriae]